MVQTKTDLLTVCDQHSFNFKNWWTAFCQKQSTLSVVIPSRIINILSDDHFDQICLLQGAEMTTILAQLSAGPEALAAALLYPSYQQKQIDPVILQKNCQSIWSIISGAQNMIAVQAMRKSRKTATHYQQVDRLRKMLIAMINDVRVALVKLAERTYVLRHADRNLSSAAQKVLAYEILNIYAPLANRLGIGQIKWELEDRAFRYLHRDEYRDISQKLQDKRLERETYISNIIAQLTQLLKQKNIQADVSGRIKHIYSIWRKMQKKQLTFDQLYDIRAMRILVRDIQDCYRALGVIQEIWPSLPNEFDDYIATPKPNGYRSIHLVVKGPQDKTIEIQIRTYAMHEESEMGVAAHWRYKEGVVRDAGFEARLEWLRSLLDWQKELSHDDENIEALRSEVVDSQIYVFTPAGEVIDLPAGATSLDFAYRVHTEVGHRCRGAKVNGKMVPLTTVLQTGQQIDIITTKTGQPSRDWLRADLGYIKTSRARQKVQHWFRQLNKTENAAIGKEMLLKAIKKVSAKKIDYQKVARAFNVHDVEDLHAAIATGDSRLQQVIGYIEQHFGTEIFPDLEQVKIEETKLELPRTKSNQSINHKTDLIINGVDNLLFHMAGCCHPIYGDQVIGYITQGRGVTVHRQDCQTLDQLTPKRRDRLVDVQWGQQQQTGFIVDLKILVESSQIVKTLTQFISNEAIELISLTTRTAAQKQIHIQLSLHVKDRDKLDIVKTKLSQLTGVITVKR